MCVGEVPEWVNQRLNLVNCVCSFPKSSFKKPDARLQGSPPLPPSEPQQEAESQSSSARVDLLFPSVFRLLLAFWWAEGPEPRSAPSHMRRHLLSRDTVPLISSAPISSASLDSASRWPSPCHFSETPSESGFTRRALILYQGRGAADRRLHV